MDFTVSPDTNLCAGHRGSGLQKARKSHTDLRDFLLLSVVIYPLQQLHCPWRWHCVLYIFCHILTVIAKKKLFFFLLMLLDESLHDNTSPIHIWPAFTPWQTKYHKNSPNSSIVILSWTVFLKIHTWKHKWQYSRIWSVAFKEVIKVKCVQKGRDTTGL
jgi:hypothetical protein